MSKQIEAILKLSSKIGSMAGFDAVQKRFADVDRKAKNFNRSQGLVASASSRMNRALMGAVAPAAVAYGAKRAYTAYAGLERTMTRIGITADASGEQMASALTLVRKVADDSYTPVDNVVQALDGLVASGKSLDEALALLPSVSNTAQAADASFGDMATTADALSGSLGIAAKQMDRAFDIIAYGGKAGKFELKDMARELPSLAPAFAALGYSGEEGLKRLTAALQVVRKETGTSGEAATSFMDVLSKMESNTMANNFKNFGVNIRTEMEKVRASGEDVLEGFIRISKEAVKGDLSKLPQLFTDKQMLVGMRALINRTGDLREMFLSLSDASGAVKADLDRLGNDGQAAIDKMGNAWGNLVAQIGQGIAPVITPVLEGATDFLNEGDAVTNAMKENGSNWGQRYSKFSNPNFRGSREWQSLAYQGGYRTDEQRRDAKNLDYTSLDNADRSDERYLPIPQTRDQVMRGDSVTVAAGLSLPEGLPNLPRNRSELSENPIQDFIKAGGGMNVLADFEAKFQSSGRAAADELERGGQSVADGGMSAGASIKEAAGAIETAGNNVASAIRAAISSVVRSGRGAANVNAGTSMDDAGGVE